MENYNNPSEIDFLEDELFCEWIMSPTKESESYWGNYILNNPDKIEEIDRARMILKSITKNETELSMQEVDTLWANISKSNNVRKKKNWRIYYTLAAAVLLLLIVSGWWIHYIHNKNYAVVDYSTLLSTNTEKLDIELVLADQKILKISQKESEIKYDLDGNVIINSDKSIQQESIKKHTSQELYNTVKVPKGNRTFITFSDGSKLWLNSGSCAVYPVRFLNSRREVYLQGEGYFEVTHNELWPFIVKTDQMDIKVVGTSFDVNAYSEDESAKVVLVNGKVIASTRNNPEVILMPNQMASLDYKSQKLNLSEVTAEDYISWKDGWFLCHSEELGSIVEKLQKYYDQKIEFTDESSKLYHLTGKLDIKANIDQVLQVIATTAPIDIKIQNGTIYISSRKFKW